jgi:hypothetical protein
MGSKIQPPEGPPEASQNASVQRGPWWRDRFFITVLGATIAAGGYALQAHINGEALLDVERERTQGVLKLERERFRAQLIYSATSADKIEERIERLRFLLVSGLVEDPTGKLGQAMDANKVPKLSESGFFAAGALPAEGAARNIFSQDIKGHRRTGTPGAQEAQ